VSARRAHGETPTAAAVDQAVRFAPGTSDAGLAGMLVGLVRQNLVRDPGRWRDFRKLRARVGIEVPDAEVAITLEFSRGALAVHDGIRGDPPIRIRADAETVLELTKLRIVRGLPSLGDPTTQALIGKLAAGRVRIKGAAAHIVALLRVTRLLSVMD
jgi:hypothetical protein